MVDYVKVPEEEKPRKRSRISWGKVFLIAIGIFLLLSLISSISYTITPKLGVVSISGVLMTESQTSLLTGTSLSSRDIADTLYELKNDNSVKAVLLDINSPGGSAVASEEISKAVEAVSEEKPVYALINDVGASGGFWIAVSADKIYTSPMSQVGSIGVTSASLSFEGLIDDFNISYRNLTSAPYKDLGSPFREMRDDEEVILQDLLDEIHDRFVEHVKTSRNLTQEEIEPYAQGQIFLGTTAVEANLFDEIGYYPDVIDELQEEQDLLIVEYTPSRSLFNLGLSAESITSSTPLWLLS